MRAYAVSDEDGEWVEIVFAETRGKARWQAARDFCEGSAEEALSLGVKRAARFDDLAPGPVTARQRWERGMGVCCTRCDSPITYDDPGPEDRHQDWALMFDGERPYHTRCFELLGVKPSDSVAAGGPQ